METEDGLVQNKDVFTNELTKEITTSPFCWLENITAVDISNRKLYNIEDNVKFPPNLVELNLSHNKLTKIPIVVQNLGKIKCFDISYNELNYFDEAPNFCHTIETLNLSHNSLLGPPYWIWTASPEKLLNLDLSFNINITNAFQDGYFEELLQYETSVTHLKINNCKMKNHLKLLSTFPKARVLDLGSETFSSITVNEIMDVPSAGLEKCCDTQSLNLTNTRVYNIMKNIDIFTNLIEINLSLNYIAGLPTQFCSLLNLETCILSNNSLLYLPEEFGKLKKLVTLRIDGNELCLLPDSLVELTNLKCLDIYNNCLYEFPEDLNWLTEIDFAQNYFEEPVDADYLLKKEKLRSASSGRYDGRKLELVKPDSEYSPCTSDDEEYYRSPSNRSNSGTEQRYEPPSSPENWDSDDYWEPRFCGYWTQAPHSPWLDFVKRKMEEGHFCPMDAHMVSIVEKVRYEKLCQPRAGHESDGQFDDYSDDDS